MSLYRSDGPSAHSADRARPPLGPPGPVTAGRPGTAPRHGVPGPRGKPPSQPSGDSIGGGPIQTRAEPTSRVGYRTPVPGPPTRPDRLSGQPLLPAVYRSPTPAGGEDEIAPDPTRAAGLAAAEHVAQNFHARMTGAIQGRIRSQLAGRTADLSSAAYAAGKVGTRRWVSPARP